MLTIIQSNEKVIRQNRKDILVDIRGLSTDEKPTEAYNKDIDNGSTFMEIDTGDIYFYDKENNEWKKV